MFTATAWKVGVAILLLLGIGGGAAVYHNHGGSSSAPHVPSCKAR